MTRTWLVLDSHYLCHRAFHTARELSWQGKPTGAIFGFLKSISILKEQFHTDLIAFCFEHPHLLRRDIYPEYKRRRHTKERSPAEQDAINVLQWQIKDLREKYLPTIGFKNIFCFDGYESDDIMAAIAKATEPEEETILVTADSDLFQCLHLNVNIYSPQKQKILTAKWFAKTYGIHPKRWAVVKAIAGCSGDEVKGVFRVGETTALSYLRGTLKEGTDYYNRIHSAEGKATVRRNRKLVELPFADCPVPKLQEDRISTKGWASVCKELGMRSLTGLPPVYGSRIY